MTKIKWLLAALGMAVIGLVPVLTSSSSANADPGTILQFDVMTPVTGPYVGTANPIRMVPGGGLPWMITSGTGFLSRDGRLDVQVRGLVLADHHRRHGHRDQRQHPPVPGQQGRELRDQGEGEAAGTVHRPHRVRRLTR